ncbi:MAG: PQQ-binding-like beta-propeller repeat protein [Verrucomicrobia bacterium]|nr:PQQ-binding-like beta-propeller repeat protein [Verrucomicrobiota bacterium]
MNSAAAGAGTVAVWPQFRGLGGSGVAEDADPPVHFGPQSNLVWKAALRPGNSSPCIWGDRLFLTAFESNELQTLCLDRGHGRVLWRRSVPPGKVEGTSRLSSPASSTPATDGERVVVYFGAFGLLCYGFDGAELWRKPLPVPITQHGASTSPVLSDELVLLVCDQDVGSHLLAVDKRDGRIAWRTDRAGFRRGFTTPLLWRADGREQLVVAGTLRLTAYDVASGREVWSVRGLPNEMCPSPVMGPGLIFAAGWTPGAGVPRLPSYEKLLAEDDRNHDGQLSHSEAPNGPARQHFTYIDADKDGTVTRAEWDTMAEIFGKSENALLAVRPGGQGDVTDTHVSWKQKRGLPYVPSPLCYQGRVYLVKNGGLASCFDATNGAALFQEERIGALGDYYASPVAAGGKVFLCSQNGVVSVLAAGDTLQVLARNELKENILATPAIVENTIYVRTLGSLFAFGTRRAER